jgi:hypothetical protein
MLRIADVQSTAMSPLLLPLLSTSQRFSGGQERRKSGAQGQASALEHDSSGGASLTARASHSAAGRKPDLKVQTGRLDHATNSTLPSLLISEIALQLGLSRTER